MSKPVKTTVKLSPKAPTARTRFQYRHLNYLALPPSINTVLYRRTHLISIALFIVLLILEPMTFPSLYNFIDDLTYEI